MSSTTPFPGRVEPEDPAELGPLERARLAGRLFPRHAAELGPRGATGLVAQILAWFAASQHGVVAGWQLALAGVTRHEIGARIASGHLIPLHRGVFAVGHDQLRPDGRLLAAVLAFGPDAVLSHRSAASLHGIRRGRPARVDVTVRRVGRTKRAGTFPRRPCRPLEPHETTIVEGIPVTTVERTLLDLAAVEPGKVRRALELAEETRVFDLGRIEQAIATAGRRPGRRALAAALEEVRDTEPPDLRSVFEEHFRDFVAHFGLEVPEFNQPLTVDGRTIVPDGLYRRQRIALELDSKEHHDNDSAFESDRDKIQLYALLRLTPFPITWRDLTRRSETTADRLRRLIEGSATRGPG